ncbi:methenyltetrahydromethanopterin cyclohydrolase [soil metagenome]
MDPMNLNARSSRLVESLLTRASDRKVNTQRIEGGGLAVDCGIFVRGGLAAGLDLARICLADLAEVRLVPGEVGGHACPVVQVETDHPVAACLASQYAGWQISEGESFFAMGSGPMRAAFGNEKIYETIGFREDAKQVVGVLEGRTLPTPEVVQNVANACRVAPSAVTLLIAPTASLAGGVQVVARSIETALHKLSELSFDMSRIVSAYGSAPVPPVARDDLAAIGRTNDAILYGARVVLFITGDTIEDDQLRHLGPEVPSSSSADFGEPFAETFARYNFDFYSVDPHLFSPSEIVFQNINTGQAFGFGKPRPDILARSFYSRSPSESASESESASASASETKLE